MRVTHSHRSILAIIAGLACTSATAFGTPAAPDALLDISPKVHPALAAHDGEPMKAWVFFTDKGVAPGTPMDAALAALHDTYPARAIARRHLRRTDPGLFDARDLPVHATHRDALATLGVPVLRESRWANAVSVRISASQARAIAALDFVGRVEPVRIGSGVRPVEIIDAPTPTYTDRTDYGRATTQLTQINLPALHAQGFTGQGVIVGILDTGFWRGHSAFNQPGRVLPVVAEYDFVDNDPDAGPQPGDNPNQHNHGTLILGCIRANHPGELVGGAFDASVILAKTEDLVNEAPIEEDNYVAGLEFVEFHGGDLATSSLGYIDWYTQEDLDGLTAVTTIAVNVATANGLHCLTAAGNAGHDDNPTTSTLIAPADALRVITCGSGRADGTTSGFSSSGPTADGRVKPEVLARGSNTNTVSPSDPDAYVQASGTSLSTPLVAAAVACLVQARPSWTVDQMRAAIFSTASDYAVNATHDPLFIRGYGFINAAAALGQPCDPDVTGDGNVDQDDIACLAQAVAGDGSCTAADPDFNQDGNVDQDDVAALAQVVAGSDCP